MDSPHFFAAFFNTSAFLLCVGYLIYVLAIMRPFLRRTDTDADARERFHWHYIVPCLNEEQVIEATIRHISSTFPESIIWCIDDASDDATPLILARLHLDLPNVEVVTRTFPEAQKGKGAALNSAWSAINDFLDSIDEEVDREKVIVGVLDADARLDRVCPDIISGPEAFGDPQIAAVQIRVRITNDVDGLASGDLGLLEQSLSHNEQWTSELRGDTVLVRLQDLEFNGPIAAMQALRERTGSVGLGGNGQFTRLAALNRISLEHGTPWHGALLEDFELGLNVLLLGMRTSYCNDTYVAQLGLNSLKLLIRQRSRWAQGGMQCMRYLWRVLTTPEIPLSGALEITYYLFVPWTQLIGSIVFPTALIIDAHYAISGTKGGISAWWQAGAWGIVPLAFLFGILPQIVWGPLYRSRCDNTVSLWVSVRLAFANVLYGYILQVAVWWAAIRLLRRRSDWKKTTHLGLHLHRPHLHHAPTQEESPEKVLVS